jgi:hypothetical protein
VVAVAPAAASLEDGVQLGFLVLLELEDGAAEADLGGGGRAGAPESRVAMSPRDASKNHGNLGLPLRRCCPRRHALLESVAT